ncbi:hypothetical protein ElyMa_005488300 [Elysia marginata]|uniref:Uncharacterized protein n=1 Tax=Elysia marginata TaxID=1093978 RepID=A0AAV4ES37_9GAST|nr:hypothetical protein ElyMa_005488300 [Elysia marginata]
MQASFYNYGTTSTSNQNSYDVSFDQGTWQQPGAVQSSDQPHQQDSAYYTGVISGAPQNYYTGTTSGNSAAMGGNFAQGATTSVSKPPQLTPGIVNTNQMESGPQYGNNTVPYSAPNQYQDSAAGHMNYNSNDLNYYGYSNDQYTTNSGDVMANNESYNTMGLGIGNSSGGVRSDTTAVSMGSSVGMGANSGGASMGVTGENMYMNSNTGSVNRAGGNVGIGPNDVKRLSNNRGMGMTYKGGGMGMHTVTGRKTDFQNNMATAENVENSSDTFNNNYDYNYNNNDYYFCGNNGSNYQNFRGRGSYFQNHPRGNLSGSRGQFSSGSRGDWRPSSGFKNNYFHADRRGRRGFIGGPHNHGRDLNHSSEGHHSGYLMGKGGEGSLSIHLSPAHYNKWCYLRKKFGKRDNELAEYLLDIHDEYCPGNKEQSEPQKPIRKRKVSEETRETPSSDDVEEELTEEEIQMKELMGFAGFKSSKGSKPRDLCFSAADCAKSLPKSPNETEEQGSATITTLTAEERRAMASLGGFSVFAKSDSVDPVAVGFGAPAITFTPMDESTKSTTPS